MIVGCGTVVPDGSLPVYSLDTEEEARQLIVLTCGTTMTGEHYARELAHEQTLPNLRAFSDRLAEAHEWMKQKALERNAIQEKPVAKRAKIQKTVVIVDDHTAKAVLFQGTASQAIKAWRNGETALMTKRTQAKRLGTLSVESYEEQFIQVRMLIS